MQRTKSMYYKETAESTELFLYAVNTSELYHRYTVPTIHNLIKKYKRNQYDQQKAIDAWFNVATVAGKMYSKEFCTANNNPFDVTARFTAACEMERRYFENVENDDI